MFDATSFEALDPTPGCISGMNPAYGTWGAEPMNCQFFQPWVREMFDAIE
jgi:hypothetical protein